MSMALSGMKTLLVDVDFRKPMIGKILGIEASLGLTSYITGEAVLGEIIYNTKLENLFIIPCGVIPPNPAELLSSDSFSMFAKSIKHQYIGEVKGQADIIIFDTPPLGSVIDAAIVSALTDGTILVIKPKLTNYKLACRVKEQLEKANANLLGVVINRIGKKDLRYGYNNYYNYYTVAYVGGEKTKEAKIKDGKRLENLFKSFVKRIKLYS